MRISNAQAVIAMGVIASSVQNADSRLVARELASAARLCRARGVQFTGLRRALLQALWEARGPTGAYELLRQLEASQNRHFTPTTIYRTLDFLLESGFAARIESRNAYIPRARPRLENVSAFFVCARCNALVEIEDPSLGKLLARHAQTNGFSVQRSVLELEGLCAACLGST